MHEEYDKSLHAPWRLKEMESAPQELDEEKLAVTIADILNDDPQAQAKVEKIRRPEFPDLKPQDQVVPQGEQESAGLSAVLRQKWAELSGAA
ncbi:MAG: hypothetical protein AAGK26_06630 [Pseudomonadota bacterium]